MGTDVVGSRKHPCSLGIHLLDGGVLIGHQVVDGLHRSFHGRSVALGLGDALLGCLLGLRIGSLDSVSAGVFALGRSLEKGRVWRRKRGLQWWAEQQGKK